MALPKWAQSQIKMLDNAVERLKRQVDRLTKENARLARELELATESWSDEDRDTNRKKAQAS